MRLELLFPTPLVITEFNRPISQEEFEFSKNIELRPNVQNRTSIDANVLDHDVLSDIKKFIITSVEKYFDEFWKPDELEIYLTQSWINHSEVGEEHHVHAHPNSIVSGVFYFDADKNVDKITFIRQHHKELSILPREYTPFTSASWFYPVNKGTLLLFPSNLHHNVGKVEPSPMRDTRISLAFNTFIKGCINKGNVHLSELILR
jgi:uncharacterized protein (TIGR02466 family)